jgi:hypothetical protein
VPEAYRTPNHQSGPKEKHPRHIIIKTLSTLNKQRILKAGKEKSQVTYKGKPIRIASDFSTQTLNARSLWKDKIQALKESNCQPRLVYLAKVSFPIEGKLKPTTSREN